MPFAVLFIYCVIAILLHFMEFVNSCTTAGSYSTVFTLLHLFHIVSCNHLIPKRIKFIFFRLKIQYTMPHESKVKKLK